ncbi:hypothetical protein DFP93_10973 [Aneurinibacillus soli]|uniref:Uncharacterized protein n=1 Tax=Aneurinibacillus soli TaxID=1500254 RepID=A0A0U5BC83_9BACL|nr:MBL fold metallo-hydrolase [Aneurinibacillus soli]PYE61372.1 hypothetical protein DFP93_10973 [Aneurinibacillus soli]BAU27799.1 hypothetical protein CB4_01973 [Aneurinibacillus soli]
MGEIGSLFSEQKIQMHFATHTSIEPVWLTENMVLLGEIPRYFDFEGKEAIGTVERNGEESDDFVIDDTALAYRSPNGLVIIVGCAHSGICNIVEYAKQVCGDERIIDIIGGFHLQNPSKEQMEQTVEYMKGLRLPIMHPCHCTDFSSKVALSRAASVQEVGVGLRLQYE